MNFLDRFSKKKNPANIKLHKNPSNSSRVGRSVQTEGQTDRQADRHDEANSPFRNFENAPNKNVQSNINSSGCFRTCELQDTKRYFMFFFTVQCNIIVHYKQTKSTFSKLIF